MKKVFALLLTLSLVFALAPVTFAASVEATQAAQKLHTMGLFNGTGTNMDGTPNFDLDRAPTRNEAVTMLIRLLGKETEAQGQVWASPFTDVDSWAKPYVGYAYAHDLANGTDLDKFSGSATITVSQYLTLVLRALSYRDGIDFQWDKAWELSDKLGITNGQYNASSEFTRGDVAIISYHALNTPPKEGNDSMSESLQLKTANIDNMIAVLETHESGLTAYINGLELVYVGLDSASTWGEIAALLRQEQAQFILARDYFRKAAGLCYNFSDLQPLKQYLFDMAASFQAICDYTITENNVWEYSELEDTLNAQYDKLDAAIQAEVDHWIEGVS